MFKLTLSTILIIITIVVLNYFLCYIQTIRNLLSFVCLVLAIALAIGQSFGLHYYPILMLLTYVGAIVVVTLFLVLTFDIRKEYKIKKHLIENRYWILVTACLIDFFINMADLLLSRVDFATNSKAAESISMYSYELGYIKCQKMAAYPDLCQSFLTVNNLDLSLYGLLNSSSQDFAVISSNFYTTNSFLFICLTIILTVAFIAALSIYKQK